MPDYYAQTAFRYAGIDYPQGRRSYPQALGDVLAAAGFLVSANVPDGGAYPIPASAPVLYGTYAARPAAGPLYAGKLYISTDRYLGAPAFCDATSWIEFAVPDRPRSEVTASRAITAADDGVRLISTSASAVNLTVPTGLAVGFAFRVTQEGAGKVSIIGGATISAQASKIATAGQHATIEILQSWASINIYTVTGQSGT